MLGVTDRGCVSISIDVGQRPKSSGSGTSDVLLSQVLKRFDDLRMPATWALADPVAAPVAAQIAASQQQHELSLLADESVFSKSDRPRFEFMRHVIRPLQMATSAGRPISTLSLTEPWQPCHLDLLTKYGVTMIRSPRRMHSANSALQSACYGLAHVSVSATISGGGRIANRAQLSAAIGAINQAAVPGGFCHLRFDLASISQSDSAAGLQIADRVLDDAARLRADGRIAVENLRQVGIRLNRKRGILPARSILRAA
jgi:hypothetical protein